VPAHIQTPHPFNLSHLASALSSPAAVQARPPAHFDASWSQARAGPAPQIGWSENYPPQIARPGPTENWANGFTGEGKGKGRAQAYSPQAHPDQIYAQQMQGDQMRSDPHMSYAPQMAMGMGMGMGMRSGLSNGMPAGTNFETMYKASYLPRAADAVSPDPQALLALSKEEHAEMEAAFEKAFDEVRSAGQEEVEKQEQEEGPPAEEMREAKGEFDKVWESLRPEAERLNKLAEWESEFSQVSTVFSLADFVVHKRRG
jgi:peroxin-5